MASKTGKLRDLDGWVRNRLRYCIWADWKKPERMCGLHLKGPKKSLQHVGFCYAAVHFHIYLSTYLLISTFLNPCSIIMLK